MEPVRAVLDGTVLATLLGSQPHPPATGAELVMSRFAWLRRDQDGLIAESATGPEAVRLEDPRATALLTRFARPAALDEALAAAAGLPLAAAIELAGLLCGARVVVGLEAAAAEDAPPLATWEFHDLLFHSRSRLGPQRRSGGTYRFAGRLPEPAAIPATPWPAGSALPVPDWEQIERTDPPLGAVQSRRMSYRRYAEVPITRAQLGEFLYRVGRIEDVWATGGESLIAKPYPSGGSRHELDLYAAVRACADVEPGLYHYAADVHALQRVAPMTTAVSDLLDGGAASMDADPAAMQVLMAIVARTDRVAWKYEGIAYALILKHVGVLQQTMYLAATAMELAPCAIGAGDSELFERATGLDPHAHAAVGEFALGSRADH